MNTRPEERLSYRELARQGARVARHLPAEVLSRLVEIAPGRDRLSVELAFELDDQQRPWVEGRAEVTAAVTCQRCLEAFDRVIAAGFRLCIVTEEQTASALAEEVDVLVVDADSVTVAQIVEDELLLALPERLCTTEPCEYAPPLAYPADETPEPEPADNPFSVLAALKKRADS